MVQDSYSELNECVRCGDEYEPYLVLVRDNFVDIVESVKTEKEWDLHEGDNDGLCKPCRMAVTDYGAYLSDDEKEELEPKEEIPA